MIDITTNITPIEREYPNGFSIEKWVGSVAIKDEVEKRIKLLESSLRD